MTISKRMGLPASKPLPARIGQSAIAPVSTQSRKLKRGELLFAEGENSRAMYLVKYGMIRLYKRKGDAHIELDTVHADQVLGELAFLDGNPRSASAEALIDCELVEISGPVFQEVLKKMPDWLKILLKTVVGRLRAASTRIRQLETASTAYDYSEKGGTRTANYIFLSPTDVLKIASGVLLVAARNGSPANGGVDVRVGLLQRYVNQIMGVPIAKVTTFIDILEQAKITSSTSEEGLTKVTLLDIDFLEQLIAYLNEQNVIEPSKRQDLTLRGFYVMSLIAKYLHRFPKDPATGMSTPNIAEIKKAESRADGKEPFRNEEIPELVKLGYISSLNVKSQEEIFTLLKPDTFTHSYRLQRVVMIIRSVNEQKNQGGSVLNKK